MNLAKYIDHTILAQDATKVDVDKIIAEAKEYNFASVVVNPYWVAYVADKLKGTGINTVTVIGFPLGANTTATKVFEANEALKNGADEIDMVLNVGELKAGNNDAVYHDIKEVVTVGHNLGKKVKVIIETCLLTDDEKVLACELCKKAQADFVKTSTGFSKAGAKVEDVALMKRTVGNDLEVKASGGIHSKEDALAMIEAGASRLGASSGVKIMNS